MMLFTESSARARRQAHCFPWAMQPAVPRSRWSSPWLPRRQISTALPSLEDTSTLRPSGLIASRSAAGDRVRRGTFAGERQPRRLALEPRDEQVAGSAAGDVAVAAARRDGERRKRRRAFAVAARVGADAAERRRELRERELSMGAV